MRHVYITVINGSEAEQFDSSEEAWGSLATIIEKYLERLEPIDDLNTHHAEWDMFHADVRARALQFWTSHGLMDAPDGSLWGVTEYPQREARQRVQT